MKKDMNFGFHRIWALIERDLRRFRRSPALILVSMILPLFQLLVLGYAFGGKVKHLEVGVVDQDHHIAAVEIKEMLEAVAAGDRTFTTIPYSSRGLAMQDLRDGRLNAVLVIPPDFSSKVRAGTNPRLAIIEDNTDQFSSSALTAKLTEILTAYNSTSVPSRQTGTATLSFVELYPYAPYIQFLLPGAIVLAIFVSAMIGGGIIYIDDKAQGLHEGYLVTPITKFDLIMGFNLAGAIKAVLAGLVLVVVGSFIAGIPDPLNLLRLARMLILVILTALALISMMFLLMVRVNDPLLPRAIFGVLNTLLFFPSGAVYPTNAFPTWLKAIAVIDPFTYAVHGFKSLLLKNTGFAAIGFDLLFLSLFTLITMSVATMLFRRTL
jgi:ABC-2 type transport system permease protein